MKGYWPLSNLLSGAHDERVTVGRPRNGDLRPACHLRASSDPRSDPTTLRLVVSGNRNLSHQESLAYGATLRILRNLRREIRRLTSAARNLPSHARRVDEIRNVSIFLPSL